MGKPVLIQKQGYVGQHGVTILARMLCYAIIILFGWKPACAQIVPVGKGSYATLPPAGFATPSNQFGEPITPLVTDRFSSPVPTNDWWTSMA